MANIFGPRYTLIGQDGNAYSIMGYVRRAMKQQRFSQQEIDEYIGAATSSDYENLINVSNEYIGLCNDRHIESTKYDVEVKQQEYDDALQHMLALERELRCAQIECDIRKKRLDHAKMFSNKK